MSMKGTSKHAEGSVLVTCAASVLFLSASAFGSLITRSDFASNDNVITFETGTTALPNIPGVNLQLADEDASFIYGNPPPNTYVFGQQFLGNLTNGPYGYAPIEIDFTSPQTAVGAYLVEIDSRVPTLISTVYDSKGAVEESVTTKLAGVDAPVSRLPFVGFSEPQGISSIVFSFLIPVYPQTQGGFLGVDNVVYGAVVPEPASIGLAVGALAFVSGRRRRRSRS